MLISFRELPEKIREDTTIKAALYLGHTVLIGNFDTGASRRDEGQYAVVIVDGRPVTNSGEALKALPPGTQTLYVCIPKTWREDYSDQNVLVSLYTVEEYLSEITPPAASLNA